MTQALTPFTKRIEFQRNDWIMVYHGQDILRREFFCFIRCGLEGYTKMQNDFYNKTPALPAGYGQVIYKDYLPQPDEKAQAYLENWIKQNS